MKKILLFLMLLVGFTLLTSCGDDDPSIVDPIKGSRVIVRCHDNNKNGAFIEGKASFYKVDSQQTAITHVVGTDWILSDNGIKIYSSKEGFVNLEGTSVIEVDSPYNYMVLFEPYIYPGNYIYLYIEVPKNKLVDLTFTYPKNN